MPKKVVWRKRQGRGHRRPRLRPLHKPRHWEHASKIGPVQKRERNAQPAIPNGALSLRRTNALLFYFSFFQENERLKAPRTPTRIKRSECVLPRPSYAITPQLSRSRRSSESSATANCPYQHMVKTTSFAQLLRRSF